MLLSLPDEIVENIVRVLPLDDQARTACVSRRLYKAVAVVDAAGALKREFRDVMECAIIGGGRGKRRQFSPEVVLSSCVPGAAWVMAFASMNGGRRVVFMPEQTRPVQYALAVTDLSSRCSWLYGIAFASPPRIRAAHATAMASSYYGGMEEKHGFEAGRHPLPTDERVVPAVLFLTSLTASPSLTDLFL